MLLRHSLTLGLVVLATACATGTTGTQQRSRTRNQLLAEEIAPVMAANAYEAVTRLRPEWLRQRGPSSMRNPAGEALVIYLDGARFGGLEVLRTIRAESIAAMEYLDGPDASIRFGVGHGGGAILVRTR